MAVKTDDYRITRDYMNVPRILIICATYLVGDFIGYLLSIVLSGFHSAILQIVFGVAFTLLFPWPVFKRLGWLPIFPKCPHPDCDGDQYELVEYQDGITIWKCVRCGQKIELRGETILVLSSDESITARLVLAWPKFNGRWKLMRC